MLTDGPSPASFLLQLICRPATLSLLRTHKYRVKERERESVGHRYLSFSMLDAASHGIQITDCIANDPLLSLSLSFSFPLCLPFHVTMCPSVRMSFVQTKHTKSWSCVRLHKTTTKKPNDDDVCKGFDVVCECASSTEEGEQDDMGTEEQGNRRWS